MKQVEGMAFKRQRGELCIRSDSDDSIGLVSFKCNVCMVNYRAAEVTCWLILMRHSQEMIYLRPPV